MAKIGRNEKCPCQSGKKYKHCCAQKTQQPREMSAAESLKVTLMGAVERIQADAVARKEVCHELGVFFFYSTKNGDGWVLEMTEKDCVQVARNGEALEPPIDENSETIEINWSHRFKLENKTLTLTAYADNAVVLLEDAPTSQLNGAIRRIHKRFSKEQLQKVHLPTPEDAPVLTDSDKVSDSDKGAEATA